MLTLHRTLEFVDPRERAQSPVPLCAPPGFQAHGHALRPCGACLCSYLTDGVCRRSLQVVRKQTASMRTCVRWRTPPVVRRQRRDQPLVLFQRKSWRPPFRVSRGAHTSLLRVPTVLTHLFFVRVPEERTWTDFRSVFQARSMPSPHLQVRQCSGVVFRTRPVLCVSCVWTNLPKCDAPDGAVS